MHLDRMINRTIVIVLVSVIVWIGVSDQASALMLKLSLGELVSGTESIIEGKVTYRKSHWNRDQTRIFTTVVVSVEERLKGIANPTHLAIALPGGKIGDITETVSDVPDFFVGEKVLIFVNRLSDERISEDGLQNSADFGPWFEVHGGFQGKFSIIENKVGQIPLKEFKERISKALTGDISADSESEIIQNLDADSSVLTISGITPASASAGTNTLITVNGDGFGASTGTPYFFYKNDVSYGCLSCVSSWSDNNVVVKVPIFTASDGYPASAGSGPFYLATPSGRKSSFFPFSVTFAYGGIRWTGSSPVVEFKVNPNGDADILKAVQNAANTWNAVSNKSFTLKYAGATPAVKTATNLINEIIWADLQTGIIGQSSMRSSLGAISECDIIFNTKYKWSSSAATPKDAMDVHTVALHELGHWLNLRDLYGNVSGYPTDIDKIMYGYGGYASQKRSLTTYDSLGMQYIYPGQNPCAASLAMTDSTYHLFVPIINTTPSLWVEFQLNPDSTINPMFRLINSGEPANPSGTSACQPSTLSLVDSNYILHIPELIFDNVSYRIDLVYVPTTDGLIWFTLAGVWAN